MNNEKVLKNIKSISGSLRVIVALIMLVAVGSLSFLMVLSGNTQPGVKLLSLVSAVELAALWFLYKILSNFMKGSIFMADNVHWLKTSVYLKVASWGLGAIYLVAYKQTGAFPTNPGGDLVLLLMMALFAY
ncbi:MAG TPA: hypothetical protein PLL10_03730, partial [Elusimicrobiales bacterium]|nr:hypothetical protein [Elusimicrobiales bacterium]